jgi:hypothetical protein
MRIFKNKTQVFKYIIKEHCSKDDLLLIRGSTAKKPVKQFSDIDAEVRGKNKKRPYYEIVFIQKKIILVTIYFYKYKKGKEVKPPKNIKVIVGKYNNNLKPDFTIKKRYIKRECQIAIDFIFKYLRTKNKKFLKNVQKRL